MNASSVASVVSNLVANGEAYRVAYRLTHNPANAADLVSVATVNALTNVDKVMPGSNVRAWFYRVMRNAFVNDFRRAKMAGAKDLRNVAGWACETATDHDETPVASDMLAAVEALPDGTRAVLALRMEGLAYAEIATELDVPIGTVMSRLFRARESLASHPAFVGKV